MREQTVIVDQATRLREIALGTYAVQTATMPYRISVTSGKGGVGKSTVALNLAIALCNYGQKVLLVDADSNLGNLDVLLGIAPRYRLGHVLHGKVDIEDALVSRYANLKILPGSSGDVDYPEMTTIVQQRFLQDLFSIEEHFDVLLIDTSAGLSKETVTYSLESDEAIVVTSIEPTSVMDSVRRDQDHFDIPSRRTDFCAHECGATAESGRRNCAETENGRRPFPETRYRLSGLDSFRCQHAQCRSRARTGYHAISVERCIPFAASSGSNHHQSIP